MNNIFLNAKHTKREFILEIQHYKMYYPSMHTISRYAKIHSQYIFLLENHEQSQVCKNPHLERLEAGLSYFPFLSTLTKYNTKLWKVCLLSISHSILVMKKVPQVSISLSESCLSANVNRQFKSQISRGKDKFCIGDFPSRNDKLSWITHGLQSIQYQTPTMSLVGYSPQLPHCRSCKKEK